MAPFFWSTVSLNKFNHIENFLTLKKYTGVPAFICCAYLSSFPHYTLVLKEIWLVRKDSVHINFLHLVLTCPKWIRGFWRGLSGFPSITCQTCFFHREKNSDYLLIFVEILFLYFSAIIRSHQFSPFQFSRSVVSDSLRPHESQHARPPCPSPTPGVHSNSCPLSRWYHPAISSSVIPFSSCPQSLPASGSVGSYIRHYWQNVGMAPTPLLIHQARSQDEGVWSYDSDLFFPFFCWVGWKEC